MFIAVCWLSEGEKGLNVDIVLTIKDWVLSGNITGNHSLFFQSFVKQKVFWVKLVCMNFVMCITYLAHSLSPPGAPDHFHCICASSHPGFLLELAPRKQSTTADRIVHPWIHSSQTDSLYPGQSFKTSLVPLLALTCPSAKLRDTQLTPLSSCHKTLCYWSVAQSSQYSGHFELENEWKVMIVFHVLWSPRVQKSCRLNCINSDDGRSAGMMTVVSVVLGPEQCVHALSSPVVPARVCFFVVASQTLWAEVPESL